MARVNTDHKHAKVKKKTDEALQWLAIKQKERFRSGKYPIASYCIQVRLFSGYWR